MKRVILIVVAVVMASLVCALAFASAYGLAVVHVFQQDMAGGFVFLGVFCFLFVGIASAGAIAMLATRDNF